ncbi:hypothetical protein ACTFIT_003157 [Dictyostelium discoideum]
MIDIVEKIFRDCTTMFTNYFKDAKIGIKRKDQCSGVVHLSQENSNKSESLNAGVVGIPMIVLICCCYCCCNGGGFTYCCAFDGVGGGGGFTYCCTFGSEVLVPAAFRLVAATAVVTVVGISFGVPITLLICCCV